MYTCFNCIITDVAEDDELSSGDDESEDDLVLEAPGNGNIICIF